MGDIDTFRSVLAYDPSTGKFTWLVKSSTHVEAGRIAGGIDGNGYILIKFQERAYKAHRLAWLFTHGGWPEGEIDHINGDRTDNRLANLRVVTREQNQANAKRRRDNRSGFKGVRLYKPGRWQARIVSGGRMKSLGYFDTPEAASAAYAQAAGALRGVFARSE